MAKTEAPAASAAAIRAKLDESRTVHALGLVFELHQPTAAEMLKLRESIPDLRDELSGYEAMLKLAAGSLELCSHALDLKPGEWEELIMRAGGPEAPLASAALELTGIRLMDDEETAAPAQDPT